jgi:hypothetical protein
MTCFASGVEKVCNMFLTSRCAALVVVMPQMTHSWRSRGADSDPVSEAEYSGVAVPDAEPS